MSACFDFQSADGKVVLSYAAAVDSNPVPELWDIV
jgi:hypothetical protein